MKTVTVNEPFTLTLWDFAQMHSGGVLIAILLAALAAFIFAEKGT